MTQYDNSEVHSPQPVLPHGVGQFASDVLSVVRDRQATSGDGARQFVIDHLMRAVLKANTFDPMILMEELRGHRLTVDEIIDTYIPSAARSLGILWVEDTIGFAAVTIGALRLQSLLGEASCEHRPETASDVAWMNTIVIVPQGEQHFLGASVVSAQLRRMGCEVATSFDEAPHMLADRVRRQIPDLVLVTCSSPLTLERARQTVLGVRNALQDGPVIALGGALIADDAEIRDYTGVDIVTNVARDAVAFCARRKGAPSRS